MFKLALVTVLLGLAASAAIDEKNAEVKSYKNIPADAEGNFAFAFDTTNNIAIQESGNSDAVNGAAQWISPEGEQVKLTFVADGNGYQPQGSHLPTPPPIPDAILKSLEYIRAHPPKEAPANLPLRG